MARRIVEKRVRTDNGQRLEIRLRASGRGGFYCMSSRQKSTFRKSERSWRKERATSRPTRAARQLWHAMLATDGSKVVDFTPRENARCELGHPSRDVQYHE